MFYLKCVMKFYFSKVNVEYFQIFHRCGGILLIFVDSFISIHTLVCFRVTANAQKAATSQCDVHHHTAISDGSKGAPGTRAPASEPNFFHFHEVFT